MGLDPAMVVGERDRFDVNQGEIGNCWFLAALANLADDDICFNRVVPSGQDFGPDYCGVFRFRFFRFGEWVEVCVDDRLPTRHGRLIYLRAKDPNEFWSPLLEKVVPVVRLDYKNCDISGLCKDVWLLLLPFWGSQHRSSSGFHRGHP